MNHRPMELGRPASGMLVILELIEGLQLICNTLLVPACWTLMHALAIFIKTTPFSLILHPEVNDILVAVQVKES